MAAGVPRASLVVAAVGGHRASVACAAVAVPGFAAPSLAIVLFILFYTGMPSRQAFAVIQAARRPRPGQFNQVLSRACLKRLCRTSADRENTPLRYAGAQKDAARENH